MGFQEDMQAREREHLILLQYFFIPLKFELVSCLPFRERNRSDKLPVFLHMYENEQGNFTSQSAVGRKKNYEALYIYNHD